MSAYQQKLQKIIDNSQGTVVRTLDHLPCMAQESLARALGYPYQYPQLDPLIKCMMAAQIKQGRIGFIGENPAQSRQAFDTQMKAIRKQPTYVKRVEDLRLSLQSLSLIHI